jgi:carbonic anhydrase
VRTPADALRALRSGNRRYRAGRLELRDYSFVGEEVAARQQPFAAILACADSRVSPTLIFDVGRGNLFEPRVAGNSVETGTLGSTEYAVGVLGVKLVLVLGHTNCGAVKAAIEVAEGRKQYPPDQYGAIGSFVDAVVPHVAGAPNLDAAIEANAKAQARILAGTGPIVAPAVQAGTVAVAAAVYEIHTGRVRYV